MGKTAAGRSTCSERHRSPPLISPWSRPQTSCEGSNLRANSVVKWPPSRMPRCSTSPLNSIPIHRSRGADLEFAGHRHGLRCLVCCRRREPRGGTGNLGRAAGPRPWPNLSICVATADRRRPPGLIQSFDGGQASTMCSSPSHRITHVWFAALKRTMDGCRRPVLLARSPT